jgi:cytochrome c biogenesis protein CcdA
LQSWLSAATAPLGNWMQQRFGAVTQRTGLSGQFGVGVLLGAVWTPCVGPTLGAASVLAAQGRDLTHVAITMLVFAIGTALPLLLLGFVSRQALLRWRSRMLATGRTGKIALGVILVATGLLILGGWDKPMEAALLDLMPSWMTDLAFRY